MEYFRYCHRVVFQDFRTKNELEKRSFVHFHSAKCSLITRWYSTLYRNEIAQAVFPHIVVRYCDEAIGYGVFATQPIASQTFLGIYAGVIRPRSELSNDYCFAHGLWSYVIDGKDYGNETRFINHSDTPNCEAFTLFDGAIFCIALRTISRIEPGEQLAYDYGKEYWKTKTKKTLVNNYAIQIH